MIRILIALSLLSGCSASISPYALASAGRIGCPADYIELSHVHRGGGAPEAWVARCGHASYACSSDGDPRKPRTRIICSDMERRRFSYRAY
jgi:hypothetical protein